MNRINVIVFALLASFTTGCASSTVIRSHPSGAIVKSMNGQTLGRTPYTHTDSAINGHQETFVIEKDGYEETVVTVRRDQWNGVRTGASIVAGLVTFWGFGGLLWAQDYEPVHQVELERDAAYELGEDSEVLAEASQAKRARGMKAIRTRRDR